LINIQKRDLQMMIETKSKKTDVSFSDCVTKGELNRLKTMVEEHLKDFKISMQEVAKKNETTL